MKHLSILSIILLFSCTTGTNKQESTESPDVGSVIILDDQALQVLDPDAGIEKLSCGYEWTEGPLWIDEGKFLIFSDIPTNTIYKYDSTGEVSVYLKPSGFTGDSTADHQPGSNGLILDRDGKLILLQQGDRRVARMLAELNNPKPNFETVAGSFEGNRFNSPNDAVMDSLGNIYFTDPAYGFQQGDDDPTKELDYHGVFCVMNDGEVRLLDKTHVPNGIALSPDQATLYVAFSDWQNPQWYAYSIVSPGQVVDKRLFFKTDTIPGSKNSPDGMHVARNGFLFTSGPGGAWLLSPEGKALARINIPGYVSNCTLDAREEYLYLTADDCLVRLRLKK